VGVGWRLFETGFWQLNFVQGGKLMAEGCRSGAITSGGGGGGGGNDQRGVVCVRQSAGNL
jgi:hypothetical protein